MENRIAKSASSAEEYNRIVSAGKDTRVRPSDYNEKAFQQYKKAAKPNRGLSAIGTDKSPGLLGKKAAKPKAAGGLSAIGTDKSPGLLGRGGTGRSYEEAATESRERAARLAANAALPERLMPKGDMSKLLFEERSGGTVNPVINPAAQRTNYDFMTDREAAVYRYYAENDREAEAKEYLKALEMDLNKRAAEKRMADTQELAEESTIGGLYARGVGNLIQGAGAAYALGMGLAGKDVDPYHPMLMGDQIRRGTTAGLLGESTGVGKFVKEAALNFFDFGTQAAALGPLTSINMALGAGASSTVNALERGGTTDEAVAYGMVSGIAEAITERIGCERLFKLARSAKDRGEVAQVLKKLLPNMASEAAEEATAEMVNLIADVLILDEKSQLKGIFEAEIANLKLPTKEQVAKVKEWLLYACTEAEAELGSGTGQLKLRYVYDLFVTRFPAVARVVSFDTFSLWVDGALEEMRGMLANNKAVRMMVKGGEENEAY